MFFLNIAIIGSALHDIAAVKEANLLNIPTISLVDGALLFSGGGITFPIFAKTYAYSRLFLLSNFFSIFFQVSFFPTRFSSKPYKFVFRRKIRTFRG